MSAGPGRGKPQPTVVFGPFAAGTRRAGAHGLSGGLRAPSLNWLFSRSRRAVWRGPRRSPPSPCRAPPGPPVAFPSPRALGPASGIIGLVSARHPPRGGGASSAGRGAPAPASGPCGALASARGPSVGRSPAPGARRRGPLGPPLRGPASGPATAGPHALARGPPCGSRASGLRVPARRLPHPLAKSQI